MLRRILDLPLLVILMGITALVMYLPAMHALALRDFSVARPFFYAATVLLALTAMIGIAVSNRRARNVAQGHLAALLGAFLVIPVMCALPLSEAVRDTSFLNAWFEMLSSFTTTGATLYDTPGRLPASVHLWRSIVGWFGGFFVLLAAVAILAPLNLGGVEVISGRVPGRAGAGQITKIAEPSERITRYALEVFPAYGGLTLVLWVLLLLSGENGFVALCHAMGTLSTSGISPAEGLLAGRAGFTGEALMFGFMIFAVSRRTLPGVMLVNRTDPLWKDPELRLALFILMLVTAVLFLRHWIAAIELEDGKDLPAFVRALWGAMFTALSFLTTTGYVSADWASSRIWSGLQTPGMILLGLAIVGGGVATTAGGVKLLRVYALVRHGEREMERLIHPRSIGGSGQSARRLRREGAYLAWIFFMIFALSITITIGVLGLLGLDFEHGMVLSIAALTNTGPLAGIAVETPLHYAELGGAAKLVLGAAMVLGRLEMLAILVLLAPGNWRR